MTLTEFIANNPTQAALSDAQFVVWAGEETTDSAEFNTTRQDWTRLAALIGFEQVVTLKAALQAAIDNPAVDDATHNRLALIQVMMSGGIDLASDQTRGQLDDLVPAVFDAASAAALKAIGRPSHAAAVGVPAFAKTDVTAARNELATEQASEQLMLDVDNAYHRARVEAQNGGTWQTVVAAFEGA